MYCKTCICSTEYLILYHPDIFHIKLLHAINNTLMIKILTQEQSYLAYHKHTEDLHYCKSTHCYTLLKCCLFFHIDSNQLDNGKFQGCCQLIHCSQHEPKYLPVNVGYRCNNIYVIDHVIIIIMVNLLLILFCFHLASSQQYSDHQCYIYIGIYPYYLWFVVCDQVDMASLQEEYFSSSVALTVCRSCEDYIASPLLIFIWIAII